MGASAQRGTLQAFRASRLASPGARVRRLAPLRELGDDEAIALAMNHEWDELEQKLRVLERRSPTTLAEIASELRVHGEPARANAILERLGHSLDAQPLDVVNAPDFQGQRASALYRLGRWADAARLLDSLASDPQQPAEMRRVWARWLALARARLGDRAHLPAEPDTASNGLNLRNYGALFDAARLAAVLGDRARAVALLEPLQHIPGFWRHYDPDAGDFDSLVGYPPYEKLRAGH